MKKILDMLRNLACYALGWALFVVPALGTHLVWGILGMLAYPIARLGCNARRVIEPYVLVVGPMYVSTRFLKSWLYYGCEPESAAPDRLVIDRTFAPRLWLSRKSWWAENLRGDETKPVNPDASIERKASDI